jgi:hypothetical protein
VAVAALAGAAMAAEPTGHRAADRVLTAGFIALVAAAASSARRWTWFVAAGVALAAAGDPVAVGCGLAALALALASTGPIRPSPAVGAAAGGLTAIGLVRAEPVGPVGTTVVIASLAVAPVLVSGYRHAGRRARRWTRRGGVAVVGLLVVAGVGYGVALRSARGAAERGLDELALGLDAASDGDDGAAADHLDAAAAAFRSAADDLGGWLAAPARIVPVVGHNARATADMAASAADVAQAGATAASDADIDALTVGGGQLDLAQVRSLEDPLAGVAGTLADATERLDEADSPWLVPPVADRLDRVQAELVDARPDVDLAADATRLVPAMFGGDRPTRWFVAFVTPVEARGRTGFMGNFAELTATDGRVEMTRFGRASELEAGGTPGGQRTLSGPDDYVARWARFEPQATWRNITMSPDFPSVAKVMAELYPQSGGQPVDGVIAVDPAGLAALLELTGPIAVPGVDTPLTADNAAGFLLRDQYVDIPDTAERIDALESLARATFDQLTTGDLPGPRAVGDALSDAVAAGHLHAWSAAPDQQVLFEDIGVDGALPAVGDGDYLGVVSNNAVGNKIDLFLSRQIAYDVDWDPASGAVAATVTVTLTNGAPSSGLPDYVIGSPLRGEDAPGPGTNRTYLSIYSPWELDEARIDGAPAEVERQQERGRYAYSAFLDVAPGGGTRTVELRLRGQLSANDLYRLAVGTQPLPTPDQLALTVDVDGGRDVTAAPPLALDGRVASVTAALDGETTTYRIAAAP